MNNPPYIIVDEIGTVVSRTATALEYDINYQYGYVIELNETLIQYSKAPNYIAKKFPLVWLSQPFTLSTGNMISAYGEIDELRLFIITGTDKNLKASQRMTQMYKPKLYPIMNELLDQIAKSPAFMTYRAQIKKGYSMIRSTLSRSGSGT